MIHDAHAFRGEYIDLCAQIERWATDALRSTSAAQTGKVKPKLPYLFGHKLKLVRELADVDAVFVKPARVRDLMTTLEPFAKLRSDLAHAIVRVANDGDTKIYAFEAASGEVGEPEQTRFWLTPDDAAERICELKKLKKLIYDQKVRPSD